jgi:uncharacterized protein YndB with AHSA1/START domain
MKTEVTVTLTRVFDVPRERLYAAWTRAEHLKHWFGPRGFTVPSCEADPRPGGLLRLCMRSPDGKDFWVRGVFRELVAPERVLIYCVADDEDGNLSLEETIDVTLTEHSSGTRLSLRATASGSTPQARSMLEGMEPGWHQTVDRLGSHLSPRISRD